MSESGDLTGKVFVVTGATSGIGKEIARQLAARNATVVIPARERSRGEAVRAELGGGDRVVVMDGDFASQRSIRAFATEVSRRWDKIDGLVNNAGMWRTSQASTADGIEEVWATNVLGPYLLTLLLHEPLARAKGRVINTVSGFNKGLELDDVELKRRGFNGLTAYGQSKQALRWLTWSFADRWESEGISVHAFDPGLVKTDLNRSARGAFATLSNVMVKLFGVKPAKAAETASWLASSQDVAGKTRKLWAKLKEVPDTIPASELRDQLWKICETMTAASA